MQFEIMDSRWNFTAGERMVKKGDPIISIHIPQGEKLTLESVKESIDSGNGFLGERDAVSVSFLAALSGA